MLAGWQVEEMEADATLQQWEDLNESDQYEPELIEASKELEISLNHLDETIDNLMDVEAYLDGTPMQHMIGSYLDQVEDVVNALKDMKEKWARGVQD